MEDRASAYGSSFAWWSERKSCLRGPVGGGGRWSAVKHLSGSPLPPLPVSPYCCGLAWLDEAAGAQDRSMMISPKKEIARVQSSSDRACATVGGRTRSWRLPLGASFHASAETDRRLRSSHQS